MSGVVDKLHVEPGQYVKEGALLARVQIIPDVVKVSQAEADLRAARLNFDSAKKEMERFDKLREESAISEAEYAKQEVAFKLREQEVDAAENNLQLLRVGALGDERFDGKLEYISPKGQAKEGTIEFEVRAAVKLNKGVFVRSNYSANADIILDRRDKVLSVNEAWIEYEKGKTFVEVETAPQRFERRPIELGLSDGIWVEVKRGLDRETRVKKLETDWKLKESRN